MLKIREMFRANKNRDSDAISRNGYRQDENKFEVKEPR